MRFSSLGGLQNRRWLLTRRRTITIGVLIEFLRRDHLLHLGYLQSARIYVLSWRILLHTCSSLELAPYVSTGCSFDLDMIAYTLMNSTTKGHHLSVMILFMLRPPLCHANRSAQALKSTIPTAIHARMCQQ
jgi:hypothetical protein